MLKRPPRITDDMIERGAVEMATVNPMAGMVPGRMPSDGPDPGTRTPLPLPSRTVLVLRVHEGLQHVVVRDVAALAPRLDDAREQAVDLEARAVALATWCGRWGAARGGLRPHGRRNQMPHASAVPLSASPAPVARHAQ